MPPCQRWSFPCQLLPAVLPVHLPIVNFNLGGRGVIKKLPGAIVTQLNGLHAHRLAPVLGVLSDSGLPALENVLLQRLKRLGLVPKITPPGKPVPVWVRRANNSPWAKKGAGLTVHQLLHRSCPCVYARPEGRGR